MLYMKRVKLRDVCNGSSCGCFVCGRMTVKCAEQLYLTMLFEHTICDRTIFAGKHASLFQTYVILISFLPCLEAIRWSLFMLLTNWKSFKRILLVILYPNLNSAYLFLSFLQAPSFLFQFTLYFRLLFIFFHILFPFKFCYVYSSRVYTA